ncbi:uncharacterized protein LOC113239829 isoform X2 [Hyposmocoma kahamanoa]|uniref:uncharacterized protein LOC113239829 isoform X2 n=1 Tax=Hyposmocoma kahamanoa TaxID=1477025 RepID=UPI000E6D6319|nr:uncharacterized protein LOC113239829 isoform X2 [Hyposmocoma kahamanoa]
MYGGQSIVLFLCCINDYRILSAPPVHSVQKEVSSSFDQKEWLRLKKQMRERAHKLWDLTERQLEAPGSQETADVTKPRASPQMKTKQALRVKYETYPPKGRIDGYMEESLKFNDSDVTPNTDENKMISDIGKLTTIWVRPTRSTTTIIIRPMTFTHTCDYIAYYCLKIWDTGRFCARSIHHQYANFTNYCELQYVNCVESYELWFAIHPGYCIFIPKAIEWKHYPYFDDYFLDQHYREPLDEPFEAIPMHYHDKPEVQWHP